MDMSPATAPQNNGDRQSKQPVALSIGGSDCSGGAGIQADLKTFHQFSCFGTTAITLITAQNTQGVQSLELLAPNLVARQLAAVCQDLSIAAAKTGALGSADLAAKIELQWRQLYPQRRPRLVVDPVLVSKHGDPLAPHDMPTALRKHLLPLATVITPNRFEAHQLSGIAINSLESAERAARIIAADFPVAVVIKQFEPGADLVWSDDHATVLADSALTSIAVHGTGCAFSAAITALLAHDRDLLNAIAQAKTWVRHAIEQSQLWGNGPARPIFFNASV